MAAVATQPSSAPRDADGAIRNGFGAPDRFMYVAHEALRSIGHAGFLCQTHLWLDGRIDEARLRDALARLSQRYPIVVARTVKHTKRDAVHWESRPDAVCTLAVSTLERPDTASVWRYAEALFASPVDLDRIDPISFHLLHLPDGRDVLILHWCHALMDGKAPELALQEIDRLSSEVEANDPSDDSALTETSPADQDRPDEILTHLRRSTPMRRIRCSLRVIASQMGIPVRSITLVPPETTGWVLEPTRINVKTLEPDETDALTARVKRICGFSNLSPAILASVFRVISRMSPCRQGRRTIFQTDVPLNLRAPGATGPIFRNFMSFIAARATFAELGNRDALTRMLNSQMRDQLRRGIDVGNLQMMTVMSRFAGVLVSHMKDRLQRKPLTLGYGFLGPVAGGFDRFCGVPIGQLYTLNSALSPPGITLQANQCQGRINLALTYISDVIPTETAGEFLDAVAKDLLA
ncbi:MAG: hypothetical protein O7D94_07420 [Planctomycetota bacterium]|nr:hypothetical protein [Planctomycetota bacterium]